MKKKLKSQSGVTMITMILTIIVLALLLGATVTNMDIGTDIRNYNYMCADIELLEAKIMTYYNKNEDIPVTGGEIVNAEKTLGVEAKGDNYFQVDISKLYNITLNYGGGTLENQDIYIINERTHEVYYLKGTYFEDTLYHKER